MYFILTLLIVILSFAIPYLTQNVILYVVMCFIAGLSVGIAVFVMKSSYKIFVCLFSSLFTPILLNGAILQGLGLVDGDVFKLATVMYVLGNLIPLFVQWTMKLFNKKKSI